MRTASFLLETVRTGRDNADVALMLELHWTPAWDTLTAEEVTAARAESLAEMDSDEVRAAQDAGDLPLSVQLVEFELLNEDSAEVILLFYFAQGGYEEEVREAVWREDGWRLLSDHI